MRIVVVGAGGVGGYFGARLAAAGADVTFLARGAHLDAMQANGLRLESPKGNLHLPKVKASSDPAAVGLADVVLVTVKLYDLEAIAALLPTVVGADTVVIPLQNGVDAAEIVGRAVGAAHVAGGVAYIAAVIAEPGVIRHTAMDHLIFGEFGGKPSERLEPFLGACRPAGFQATLSDRIEIDIWSKFVRLAVFSGMTAVTRSPMGVLRDDPDLYAMMQAAVLEGMSVAHARGITLPHSTLEEVQTMVAGLPPNAKSSMLEDLERGKRLELPWLSGALVRIGGELGVETPIHRFIAAVLRPYADGATGKR